MIGVGLTQNEVTDIIHLLAAILHIGNLDFEEVNGQRDILSKVSNRDGEE